MAIDSTTGKESSLVEFICKKFQYAGANVTIQSIPNESGNVFLKWGDAHPNIIFCTHLDTVFPYIAPIERLDSVWGRGACDAKGQIVTMYTVCTQLFNEGYTNFGLLLLINEESNSLGAKIANELINNCQFMIIGEPTSNKLIKAANGVILFDVIAIGKSVHSGYPEYGSNAINHLQQFFNKLTNTDFPYDKILGKTTYNIGELHSINSVNVISDKAVCKILFRSTFASHDLIEKKILSLVDENINISMINKSSPINFFTLPEFETDIVHFGSDAASFTKCGTRLLFGPGSILSAHSNEEKIEISDIETAVKKLKLLYYRLRGLVC